MRTAGMQFCRMRDAGMQFGHSVFAIHGEVWCTLRSLIQLRGHLGCAQNVGVRGVAFFVDYI